jgi:hypothetical protein
MQRSRTVQDQPSTEGWPATKAEELAEQFDNAVASVRARMGRAVEAAERLDGWLWEVEKNLRDLPQRPPEDAPRDVRQGAIQAARNWAWEHAKSTDLG